MSEIAKTTLSSDGENINLSFGFTKIDKGRRTVTGVATADNIDQDNEVVDYAASQEAFQTWIGNIREMHGNRAVGKAIQSKEIMVQDASGKQYKGFQVTAYISKGAQDTWEKILDGTLTGFSVGGRIVEKVRELHKSSNQVVSRVKKYILSELSVVDNPCNPLAQFSMIKGVGIDPELTDIVTDMETVFYCTTDEIAKVGDSVCPSCVQEMQEIGFVESIEEFQLEPITKMINDYEMKKVAGANEPIDNELKMGSNGGNDLQNNNNNDIVTNMELTPDQKQSFFGKFANWFFTTNSTSAITSSNITLDFIGDNISKTADAEADAEHQEETMEKNEKVASEETSAAAEEVIEKSETPALDLDALATAIAEKLAKNVEVINDPDEGLEASDTPGQDEAIGNSPMGWSNRLSELGNTLKDVTNNVERLGKRLDDIEEKMNSMGAVKKSVDAVAEVEEADEDDKLQKSAESESVWGNTFLPKGIVEALGYRS